jgi:hypothetical protein
MGHILFPEILGHLAHQDIHHGRGILSMERQGDQGPGNSLGQFPGGPVAHAEQGHQDLRRSLNGRIGRGRMAKGVPSMIKPFGSGTCCHQGMQDQIVSEFGGIGKLAEVGNGLMAVSELPQGGIQVPAQGVGEARRGFPVQGGVENME